MVMKVLVTGIGKCLPGEPLDNDWVRHNTSLGNVSDSLLQKIGIKTRHAVMKFPYDKNEPKPKEGFYNSDISVKAVREALKCANLDKSEVDMIIVATCTPDYPVPSTASIVQDKLGIPECAVMDIRSACSGAVQGIVTAYQYLSTGYYKTIVVVGSEVGSVFGNLDMSQQGSSKGDVVNALIIGDGAGALVMRGFPPDTKEKGMEIVYSRLNCIGHNKPSGMYLPAGGSCHPCSKAALEQGLQWFKHDYKAVFAHGAELYYRGLADVFKATNLAINDIALYIPHQANGQVTDFAELMGIPRDRIYCNFDKVGNTANASLLLCLDDVAEQNLLKEGDLVCMVAAESTKWMYGSLLLKWYPLKPPSKTNTPTTPTSLRQMNVMERARRNVMFWAAGTALSVSRALQKLPNNAATPNSKL